MKRSAFLSGAAGLTAMSSFKRAKANDASEAEISLQTATGTLYGTLATPGRAPAPVVLIIAGSGPTDRDGNSRLGVNGDTYKLLAADLSQRGVASVRYDKRGIGASAAALTSESDLTFETYIGDAAGWANLLHRDVRFSGVVIAGHSEGSLIGMIAAQRIPVRAFVSLAGAGRPAPVILREQLKKNAPEVYAQSDAIITSLQHGELVKTVPADLNVLFRPAVQPYLISWFKYDPAVEIAKVRAPATIVQGTADVQVTVEDAQLLKRGDPSADLVIVNGMNHVLKHAPDTSSQAAILKGYQDPSLPVEPAVVDAIYRRATT
jgi:uncharacterized protein